eukprot:8498460-Heterocapsa_arctica.AAC.1
MEAGPGWRAVPMGQQSGNLRQTGVEGQQGELSRGYENFMSKFMSDDRSSFSREARNSTTIWRSRNVQTNFKCKTAQHQHRLEHFSSLEHTQVRFGQSCSRLYNHVNSEKYSRNMLRRDWANRGKRSTQKEGRKTKLEKPHIR